jgi:hypothetical protein
MVTDSAGLLRERGIQVTAQRLAVVRAVAGQPHITADAVAEVVRTEIGAISLQSVYDTLGLLVAAGLIRRIQPAGSPARFEDRVGDNHHHLICHLSNLRSCGRRRLRGRLRPVSRGGRRPGLRDRRGRGRLLGALPGLCRAVPRGSHAIRQPDHAEDSRGTHGRGPDEPVNDREENPAE